MHIRDWYCMSKKSWYIIYISLVWEFYTIYAKLILYIYDFYIYILKSIFGPSFFNYSCNNINYSYFFFLKLLCATLIEVFRFYLLYKHGVNECLRTVNICTVQPALFVNTTTRTSKLAYKSELHKYSMSKKYWPSLHNK